MQLDIHKLVQLVGEEQLCRICLHHIDGIPHKLDEDFEGEPLYKTYSIVTNIKFPPEEKYGPDCICNGCLKRLSSCHNFITTCCNSNFVYWIAKNHTKVEEWKNFISKDVHEISKELGLTSENNGGDVPLSTLQVYAGQNGTGEKSEEVTFDEVRVKIEKVDGRVDQVQSNNLINTPKDLNEDVEKRLQDEEPSSSSVKVEPNDAKTTGKESSSSNETTAAAVNHTQEAKTTGKESHSSNETTAAAVNHTQKAKTTGNESSSSNETTAAAVNHTQEGADELSSQNLNDSLPQRSCIILQENVTGQQKEDTPPVTIKVESPLNATCQPRTPLRNDEEQSKKHCSQPTAQLNIEEEPNAKRIKLDECSCCRTYKKRYKDLQRSPVRIECRSCNSRFFSIVALKRHLYIKHREGESFKCIICEKEFIQWYCFERHLEMTHPHVEKCTHCRRVFECSSDLKDHLVNIHKDPQILLPVH